jgi:hypothetical protein
LSKWMFVYVPVKERGDLATGSPQSRSAQSLAECE